LKNRNGGKEDIECGRQERRSRKGVGGKGVVGKEQAEKTSGKEVSWRNRAGN